MSTWRLTDDLKFSVPIEMQEEIRQLVLEARRSAGRMMLEEHFLSKLLSSKIWCLLEICSRCRVLVFVGLRQFVLVSYEIFTGFH